jgi:hypothetical protein
MKKQSRKTEKTKLPDGWKFSIATSFEEIEAIRPIWEEMQDKESSPVINADIDRYISVVEAMKEIVQPYVMILFDNNNPTAMIVAQIEKYRLEIKLGYKILLSPKLKCLNVVYGGILGKPNSDVCHFIIRGLMKQLQSRKVCMIYFNHLKINSLIYKLSRKLPGILSKGYFPEIENHFSMSVPKNIDLLYQTFVPKTRNTLRRKIKKLEREFADQIKIVTYRDEDQLQEALSVASEISRHTYQTGLNVGLVNDPKTYKIMATAARHNWLRISILYIKGEPCAFQLGRQYCKTYFLGPLGFHPRWKQWNVGTFLFFKILEDLCLDSSVEIFNFGFGDAQYKRSYSNESWNEASVCIFAPQFYPICVNMLRTCVAAVNSALKYTANKSGLTNRVKRYWRNRLARIASEKFEV